MTKRRNHPFAQIVASALQFPQAAKLVMAMARLTHVVGVRAVAVTIRFAVLAMALVVNYVPLETVLRLFVFAAMAQESSMQGSAMPVVVRQFSHAQIAW
jgi:hypothetical protein